MRYAVDRLVDPQASMIRNKAVLNRVMHTFDPHLKQKKQPTVAVRVHSGTMKAGLRKNLWKSRPKDRLCGPEEAAEHSWCR